LSSGDFIVAGGGVGITCTPSVGRETAAARPDPRADRWTARFQFRHLLYTGPPEP